MLDVAINNGISTIPECVAGGYFDLSTGKLLAVKTLESHSQESLNMLASASAELFQGTNIVAIEKMFKKRRAMADDGQNYFQEMLMFSNDLLHVFLRSSKSPDHLVCFVCRKSVNIGMALAKARIAISGNEKSFQA